MLSYLMSTLGEPLTMAAIGLFGGGLLGLAARLGRFCTLGAIEDLLYGGSDTRMRMWGLAIGLSVMGSFALMASGAFDPRASYYLSIGFMPLAAILGGLTFGYGMALAGNCGYGAIARLGGGDFRSFVIVLVMGVSAYLVLSGPLAHLRDWAFPQQAASGPVPGIAHALGRMAGVPPEWPGLLLGALICLAALASRDFRADGRALFWSSVVALAILSGWAGSYHVAQQGFDGLQTVSHSFSAPVGETLLYAMIGSAISPSFGVGSVTGVALGAFAGSLVKGHFRWEACEDPRELRRQITGAGLMGAGAVIALGCTVGQGLSAFSVLAYSAPLTCAGIFAGAALGLRQLIVGFGIPSDVA